MNWPWKSTHMCLFPIDSIRGQSLFLDLLLQHSFVSRRSASYSVSVPVGQFWVNFTSLIWNQLRLCCDHFWLYYILRTGSLFGWMIELITVVKCHFLDLGHLSPQVLNIYMRKSKNILPLAKAYFLWEDVAFSKTFQHETWFYIKDFWMFIVSFSLIYMLLEKILLQQAPVKSFMNVQ